MSRYVLIRRDREGTVVPEARLPLEAELHDALIRHPELIPASDMGLGRVVVAGRESSLAAGSADLVLLDESGRIAIVEVKKEGNPDTRRVVAQLLDYASALWGQSTEEFEQIVLRSRQAQPGGPGVASLQQFIEDSFPASESVGAMEDRTGAAIRTLGDALRTGSFTLIIAAPQIPPGVERVLDFLNARGMRLFAVEYSYFAHGSVEVLVPRLAVAPAPGSGHREEVAFDRERFLERIPAEGRSFVAEIVDRAEENGAFVKGTPTGLASIVAGSGRLSRTLCQIFPTNLWIPLTFSGPLAEPVKELHGAIDLLIPNRVRENGIRYLELTPDQRANLASALFQACRRLSEMRPT